MIGVAARTLNADHARRHAVIVQSFAAAHALAATDPRENHTIFADRHGTGIRPGGDDDSVRFMPQRHRRPHAALAHTQTFAAAEIEIAIANMHVAVAHAAVFELDEH